MRRLASWVVAIALVSAAPATAAPIFNIIPLTGNAAPGDTVGWGYEIVNDDPLYWLVISSLNADPFQHGTITDPLSIFDFPILAPDSSLIRPYVPGTQGLYEFTWDLTAPAGFVNAGVFTIGAELWDGDPFLGGLPLLTLPEFIIPYEISLASDPSPAPVPEPASLLLLASGLAAHALARRRRNRSVP
jgi:hypothetical protein